MKKLIFFLLILGLVSPALGWDRGSVVKGAIPAMAVDNMLYAGAAGLNTESRYLWGAGLGFLGGLALDSVVWSKGDSIDNAGEIAVGALIGAAIPETIWGTFAVSSSGDQFSIFLMRKW